MVEWWNVGIVGIGSTKEPLIDTATKYLKVVIPAKAGIH